MPKDILVRTQMLFFNTARMIQITAWDPQHAVCTWWTGVCPFLCSDPCWLARSQH